MSFATSRITSDRVWMQAVDSRASISDEEGADRSPSTRITLRFRRSHLLWMGQASKGGCGSRSTVEIGVRRTRIRADLVLRDPILKVVGVWLPVTSLTRRRPSRQSTSIAIYHLYPDWTNGSRKRLSRLRSQSMMPLPSAQRRPPNRLDQTGLRDPGRRDRKDQQSQKLASEMKFSQRGWARQPRNQ